MKATTIVEHSKTEGTDSLTKAYVEIFAKKSDILMALPYKNVTGGAYPYVIEDEAGGIAFRGINEAYTPDIGVENPQVEQLTVAGGDLDVDMALLKMQGNSRRAREEMKKLKRIARNVTDAILGGDSSSNHREFDGIQRRLRGNQVIDNANGAAGGAPLSLMALDDMISRVSGANYLIMNRRFRDVHFNALRRNQSLTGNLDMYKSEHLGVPVMMYNKIPMLVGYEAGPEGFILPFEEVAAGGGAAETASIYAVRLEDGYVCGLQNGPIDVRDLGEIDEKPVKRSRMEWLSGLVIEHPFAAARLSGITDAPIVA